MRYYGLDLAADLGTPRLSWRRLESLIRHLPSGTALERSVAGEVADWDIQTHLTALVLDELRHANWLTWAANTERGKRPPPFPEPVPHPGYPTPKRRGRNRTTLTPEQQAERLRNLGRR